MSMDMSCDDALMVSRALIALTRDSASALVVGNDDHIDPSARQDDEQPCTIVDWCLLAAGHKGKCVGIGKHGYDLRPLAERVRTDNGEARIPHGSFDIEPEGDSLVGTVSRSNGRQVGGTHYGLREYQHWDMVIEFGLDYFQGQITKYVMRWDKKNGVQDLEKAAHFLQKYIDEINAGTVKRG